MEAAVGKRSDKGGDRDLLLIAEGDQPLTFEQQRRQAPRLASRASHSDPSELKRQKQEQERDKQKRAAAPRNGCLMDFRTSTGGERGNIGLSFDPSPRFHPPTREAEVFHALEDTTPIRS